MLRAHTVEDVRRAEAAAMADLPVGALMQRAAAGLAAAGARALVASEGGRLVGELQTGGGEWLPFPARSSSRD